MKKSIKTSFGSILLKELETVTIPDLPSQSINLSLKSFLADEHLQFNVISQTKDYYLLSLANRITTLPKYLTPKLAYFIGYFYGDGGLKNIEKSFKITGRFDHKFKIADEFLVQIKQIKFLFEHLFGLEIPVRFERIHKGERTHYIEMTNKIIYLFLTKVFGLPCGKKDNKLNTPQIITNSSTELQQWFLRGLFDADGDTRAVEAGFKSQSRVKIRMKQLHFISELKPFIESVFKVSVNGPYFDSEGDSAYIQVERQADIIKLSGLNLFIHPIKKWRLKKTREFLLKRKNLKVIAAETITMGT
ncbi:MAG: hypothetical protein ABIH20_02985 [Candidatus Diapherotrites archaeon]